MPSVHVSLLGSIFTQADMRPDSNMCILGGQERHSAVAIPSWSLGTGGSYLDSFLPEIGLAICGRSLIARAAWGSGMDGAPGYYH